MALKIKDLLTKDGYILRTFQLTANKFLELQLSRWSHNPFFAMSLYRIRTDGDQPGFYVAMSLFRVELMATFYDRRPAKDLLPTRTAIRASEFVPNIKGALPGSSANESKVE
jgi:hypothetical protein